MHENIVEMAIFYASVFCMEMISQKFVRRYFSIDDVNTSNERLTKAIELIVGDLQFVAILRAAFQALLSKQAVFDVVNQLSWVIKKIKVKNANGSDKHHLFTN